MKGAIKAQLVDYLNASVAQVQDYELKQKNLMAINTIAFIDGQLSNIEASLRNSEQAQKNFEVKI